MKTRSTFWFVLVVVMAAYMVTWITRQYSYYPEASIVFMRIAVLGTLLIVLNFFWTWMSIRRLSVERRQRVLRLQVGNIFEEEFEVVNPIRFWRLWIDIQDLSKIPGKSGSKVLSRIGPRKNRFYNTRTMLTQRGLFLLGPTLLRSGDPFGMFISEKLFPGESKLLVLPYVESIEHAAQPPGALPGGRAIRQKSLEATSYASGVREYQPGDPLNRIHWRSSAKRNHFMVKEFDQDPQADVWVLLDGEQIANFEQPQKEKSISGNMDEFWIWDKDKKFSLPPKTFEYAVSIAASMISYFISDEKSVGFACASRSMMVMPAEYGERHLGKTLETLAFIESVGTLPINGLVEAISPQIPRGSTVVVISANNRENLQVGLELLMRRNLNPVVILIDRESFGGVTQSKHAKAYLDFQNIPYAIIKYGDEISISIQTQIK